MQNCEKGGHISQFWFIFYFLSITLYLSYRYLVIKLPAPRSPMGSSFSSFLRWCWLSCYGAFVQVSWRNKSGPITLSSSDGLSSLKAYYSGDAVIKNDGTDVFFLNPVMVSEDDSHVQKNTSSHMPCFTSNPLEEIMNKFSNISVLFFFFFLDSNDIT